jgi:hypothetical protein
MTEIRSTELEVKQATDRDVRVRRSTLVFNKQKPFHEHARICSTDNTILFETQTIHRLIYRFLYLFPV